MRDRDDLVEVLTADIARAQRMAAAGLRHLRAILGANRNAGIRDRWRRDALASTYFGATSSVVSMEAVHRRLERAHRRLRDDVLTVRIRPQSAAGENTNGRNTGGFLSPKRFQLFPAYARKTSAERAAIIVHELLHEWLRDADLNGQRVRGDNDARDLARANPRAARNNPENYEQFLLQVWADEGLEAPSGAEREDTPLVEAASAETNATGLLADRPVLAPSAVGGRRDLFFLALRARAGETMIPAVFEKDGRVLHRRGGDGATDAVSFPAAACTLPNGIIVTATRDSRRKRLMLTAWEIDGETPRRVADSADAYGDVGSHPDVIALGGNKLAVIFKGTSTGRMKVDAVEYRPRRGFTRIANAETSGPVNDHGTAALVWPLDEQSGGPISTEPGEVLIATAMRTREGKLSMDLWSVELGRRRVTRRGGLVDRKMTGRPAIAALPGEGRQDPPRIVTSVRDEETGRMRLTLFQADPDDAMRPRRLADSGLSGPRMSHSPAMIAATDNFESVVVTAIRYAPTGNLIVSTWNPESSGDVLWLRERYSGAERTPRIDSTPSIAFRGGRDATQVVTSAIGVDGRLALQAWGKPVRTNG